MTTTPKGYTELNNASSMSGPQQINAAERFVEDLIGESVATAADLPASGNWVGRLVTTVDTKSLYQCTALPGTWSVVREDTGWITPTLLNGWVNLGGSNRSAQYRRLNGVVSITGTLKSGVTAANTVIFTLPAGFRPSASLYLPTQSANALATINIAANGDITCSVNVSATTLTLQFMFIAEA